MNMGRAGASDHFRGRYTKQGTAPTSPSPAPPAPASGDPAAEPPPPINRDTSLPPQQRHSAGDSLSAQADTSLPQSPGTPQQAPWLIGAFVIALLAAVAVVGLANRSNQHANNGSAGSSMPWQASCGSPAVAGLTWWPVLGPYEAWNIVKTQYCGDAYATADGAVQVASFSSEGGAIDFAQRLSSASGYPFRVGQPRRP